jgi:predicted ATPase
LPFIVDTLRSITARRATGGRRSQVLVNSHSPYLVDLLEPDEMLVASLGNEGQTHFASVTQDLFRNRPRLKELLESGERTLGEAWSEGYLDGNA